VENDAKSRVKNILRWKRAAPAAAFLAAALCILAAVICGTDAPTGRGWVQSEGTVSAGGRMELRFSYSVPKDINSCLFYEDVYEHGKLIARNPMAYFDFSGDWNHVNRRGTAGLSGYVDSDFESGGWYFSRTNEDGNESGFSHPSYIPQRSYCASSLAYAGQNGDQTRRTLNELDAVAILFLSDDNGRLSSYNFSSQEFSPSDLFADGFTDVAAVLRVEFSRLGAEELEKAFQEDGPGAGAAQDGNQVTLKGASKGEHGSQGVGVDFRAELVKPVQSWAIYEDVYDHGVLVSSIPRISDGFLEDGTGVTSRQFSGTLLCKVSSSGGRFDGKLDCSYGDTGSPAMANWPVQLPLESYHASGSIMGSSGTSAETDTDSTISLADVHEAILITYAFSEQDGVTYYSSTVNNIALANDAAVQFRLVTSVERAEGSLGRSALQLYSLKNPYVGDMVADGKLLSALNVADLGAYKLELFTSRQPYVLQINFQNEPEDPYALNNAMDSRATILLALIGNLDEVRWSYPQTKDGIPTFLIYYFDEANALKPTGMSIKDCGASPAELQNLLNYVGLDDDTQPAGTTDGTAVQTAFDDILGQSGFIRQEFYASGFLINHYIAQVDGQETCFAESWGWGRDDTAVDLDGDGVKELVCNATYGADGVQRVFVYRLAADGSVECADPLELLDVPYRDQGIGSLSEVYNAVHNTVDISYYQEGQAGLQLKSYPLDMTRLTFSPYVCSESSNQRASAPEQR